jgi:hypothetical protein
MSWARRARVQDGKRELPTSLQSLFDARRRAALSEPEQQRESALAGAQFLMNEKNYAAVIDAVTTATRQRIATPQLLALGIEAEYQNHLAQIEPTHTFDSKFAPQLREMDPDNATLTWLDTQLAAAREQQRADAGKQDMVDTLIAEQKRLDNLEKAQKELAQRLAADRIAARNAYFMNRYYYGEGRARYIRVTGIAGL